MVIYRTLKFMSSCSPATEVAVVRHNIIVTYLWLKILAGTLNYQACEVPLLALILAIRSVATR